jgi:hypothetical protein
MGWFSANVTYEGTDEKTTQNQYGTRTPNVSQRYTDAFDRFQNSLNTRGYNPNQQQAVDYAEGYLSRGGAAGRIAPTNTALEGHRAGFNRFATATPNLLGAAPTAVAGRATATTIDGVDPIVAQQVAAQRGSAFRGDYLDPYLNEVVDASIADYDQDAAEARASLRAGNAGAFGNKRFGVTEGQFASDAALGRGSLRAGLRSDAFKFATGAGMQDADRFLTADMANQDATLRANTSTADNLLRTRTFNAGAENDASITNANNDTSVSTTNAGIRNTRDIADQGERGRVDKQAFDALVQQTGITQQIADNIFKADGIDLDVARNLFEAGTISQAQLETIMDAAREYNGYSYTQNSTGTRNSDTYGSEVGF